MTRPRRITILERQKINRDVWWFYRAADLRHRTRQELPKDFADSWWRERDMFVRARVEIRKLVGLTSAPSPDLCTYPGLDALTSPDSPELPDFQLLTLFWYLGPRVMAELVSLYEDNLKAWKDGKHVPGIDKLAKCKGSHGSDRWGSRLRMETGRHFTAHLNKLIAEGQGAPEKHRAATIADSLVDGIEHWLFINSSEGGSEIVGHVIKGFDAQNERGHLRKMFRDIAKECLRSRSTDGKRLEIIRAIWARGGIELSTKQLRRYVSTTPAPDVVEEGEFILPDGLTSGATRSSVFVPAMGRGQPIDWEAQVLDCPLRFPKD